MKEIVVEVETSEEKRHLISLSDGDGANVLLSLNSDQIKLLNWLDENGWLYNETKIISLNLSTDVVVL